MEASRPRAARPGDARRTQTLIAGAIILTHAVLVPLRTVLSHDASERAMSSAWCAYPERSGR